MPSAPAAAVGIVRARRALRRCGRALNLDVRVIVKRFAVIAALVLFGLATLGQAEEPRISGVFSNLRYSEQSGDLIGWEILVVPRQGGTYTAIVQVAEGSAPAVVIGTLVANDSNMVISIPNGQAFAGAYTATITATEMRFETPEGTERLRRGKSYWQ